MNPILPSIQKLAKLLLAGEKVRAESPGGEMSRAILACQKLRLPLIKLAGVAGFASLLSRALSLAVRKVPALAILRVEADGSITGWNANGPPTTDEGHDGAEILVAELLGLLVSLIGESLTMSLVRDAWPDASITTESSGIEEKS